MRSAVVLAALLIGTAAPAFAAASPKPRIDGWLALYNMADRKGALYTAVPIPFRQLATPYCVLRVPARAPGMPSGDTCEIRFDLCPNCDNIDGFVPEAFAFDYDDKGCTGKLANFRFVPSAINLLPYKGKRGVPTGRSGVDLSPEAFERYMKRFLTPGVFDYVGLLYLQSFRQFLHTQ